MNRHLSNRKDSNSLYISKKEKRRPHIIFALTIGILINIIGLNFVYISQVSSRSTDIPGYNYSDHLIGGNEWSSYHFWGNNTLNINATNDIDLNINLNSKLNNNYINISLYAESPINLKLNGNLFGNKFHQNKFYREKFKYRNKWNAFLEFNMNNSVNSIKISIKKSQLNHIDDEDKFAIYNPNDENWLILDTYSADGFIICQLNLSDLPFNPADPNNDNNNDNNNHIPSTSADPPSEASEYSIFLSVFHEEPLSFIELPVFKVLIVIGLIVAIISGVMSKTEYREFILNRIMNFQPRQRLSIEKVLENKNRKLIIDLIIDNPGIHFNELLRETGLSPGNLVWHLDILEEYKIIGKKNAGNYLIYFPYYMDNPISNIDFDLMKSKTTIAILNKIKETPGTYNNEIAKSLKLDHKTVKYHLDKLLEKGLIEIKKEGRKKRIYPSSKKN